MQMEQMRHRERKSRQSIDTEGVTGSNGNGNRRFIKIVSFSINNITDYDYFMQLTTEMIKLMNNLTKKFLRLKKTRATAITIPTPNV